MMDLVEWRCLFCVEAEEYFGIFPKQLPYHDRFWFEFIVEERDQEDVFRSWKQKFIFGCIPSSYGGTCLALISNNMAILGNLGYTSDEIKTQSNWKEMEEEYYGST